MHLDGLIGHRHSISRSFLPFRYAGTQTLATCSGYSTAHVQSFIQRQAKIKSTAYLIFLFAIIPNIKCIWFAKKKQKTWLKTSYFSSFFVTFWILEKYLEKNDSYEFKSNMARIRTASLTPQQNPKILSSIILMNGVLLSKCNNQLSHDRITTFPPFANVSVARVTI